MNPFNPKSKLVRGLTDIFDLIVLGLLWLLLSMTVVGIGPASAALYYAVVKSVRKGRGKPLAEFIYALKQNWKQALIVGMILTALGIAVYLYDWNYIIVLISTGTVENGLMTALAFVKLLLLFGIANYVFPILSRFHVKLPKAILISLALTFRHIFVTLYTVALLIGMILLAITAPFISWLLPGVFTWLLSVPMESVLRKYTPADEDNSVDQWYLEK